MHTSVFDRNKYFQLIRKLRGSSKKQNLAELHTPAGVYYGQDTLEGFARDAELLATFVGETTEFDNDFYRICIEDNLFIFDFKGDDSIEIPKMKMNDLERIVEQEMKNGKACDVYKLTAEHLKNCGKEAKQLILNLINDIIDNIYYLTCPQVKMGLGTAVFKGKRKPKFQSSSYRRITVTPQIGSILDRYIDPIAEEIFRPSQDSEQYGFTKNISYLLAAILRGECQRWAIDSKVTCFGVSFDGKAAFPSVNREIQIRELYSCGESGKLLEYSNNTYQNTTCRMKGDGKLSREISEYKGARQGHKRSSGHFKTYINPCLTAANSSMLGFWIGPVCISVICVADDTYVLSGCPRNLQGLINIVGHYGKRYRLVFGAEKTIVTITGSKHDMSYYEDINIWSLYGEKLAVKENNEHLGLVVSGLDEEIKNIDKNIDSARKTLFSFLGNIFSYKCKLSPAIQLRTWQIYVKPVLRSRLAALPIRPTAMKPIIKFHHKVLRSILKLSAHSPIAPLYFLLGELPMEASLHLDVLAVFWSIWSNPDTKIFKVLKYLLKMSGDKSVTWSAHTRILFSIYNLPDPLLLLETPPWSRERWKHHTQAVVTSHHEAALRCKASENMKIQYLNIQATGLSGRLHPTLAWVSNTQDVMIVRPHIKMLSGDYLTYSNLSHDRGVDPCCRLCKQLSDNTGPVEDLVHLLTSCRGTSDTRDSVMPDFLNTVATHYPTNGLLSHASHPMTTQFLLDCSSLNLPTDIRVPPNHPGFISITRHCSIVVHHIHKSRKRQLRAMGLLQ